MSESRTLSIILLALGLFFSSFGIALTTITQKIIGEMTYQEMTQPYVDAGALIAVSGIIILIGALTKAQNKKTKTMKIAISKT